MVIDGRSVESSDGQYIDIENPANRTAMARVPRATGADVDSAVRRAAAAFESWRLVAPRDRGRLLSKIADTVEAEFESLARTVAQETGNAIRTQARPEVKSAIDVLRGHRFFEPRRVSGSIRTCAFRRISSGSPVMSVALSARAVAMAKASA